jgi:hypothetical protein
MFRPTRWIAPLVVLGIVLVAAPARAAVGPLLFGPETLRTHGRARRISMTTPSTCPWR